MDKSPILPSAEGWGFFFRVMKRIGFILVLFLTLTSAAQTNLVPNWSFEDTTQCPDNFGQINRTTNWFSPNTGTPDYYNACASPVIAGVPDNVYGYQNAHSGHAYAGCLYGGLQLSPPNNREYVEVQLTDSLEAGKQYCVSYYLSFSNTSAMAVSNAGCYFSTGPITANNIYNLPVTPQIENPVGAYLIDTLNWVTLGGTYTAIGGENYLTIGNFYPDSTTDTLRLGQQNLNYYYYIDDVSVIEVTTADAGRDTIICRSGFAQLGTQPVQEVYYSWSPASSLDNPNASSPIATPTVTTSYTLTQTQCNVVSTSTVTVTVENDCSSGSGIYIPSLLQGDQVLYIEGLESKSKLEIYDSRGRLVFNVDDYSSNFNTSQVEQGNYIVRLTRPGGELITQKLMVVK